MKRIGIISDTHGDTGYFQQALMKMEAEGPLDALIHCGDGLREAKSLCQNIMQLVTVQGNNDYGCDAPDECTVSLGGLRFFITHGHRYRVKSGLEMLADAALACGAQIVCFGHTHRAVIETRNGMLLLNPGACVFSGKCLLVTIQNGAYSINPL